MSRSNSIAEWLARVAKECGSPAQMEIQGLLLKNANSQRLIIEYAKLWAKKLDERRRA